MSDTIRYDTNAIEGLSTTLTTWFSVLSIYVRLAICDGALNTKERQFIAKHLAHPAIPADTIHSLIEDAINDRLDLGSTIARFLRCQPNNPKLYYSICRHAIELSLVDGPFMQQEEWWIRGLMNQLELPAGTLEEQIQDIFCPPNPTLSPYQLLGLDKKTNHSKLKEQFIYLSKLYHPDRLSQADISPLYRQLAQQHFIKIQQAYQQLQLKHTAK
jgi:hypothetical protein